MPGFIRQFRFLERIFPPQRLVGVQPSSVSNDVQLVHEILKPGLLTGFQMRSSIFSVVADGGSQTFAIGLEPNVGNLSIPVYVSVNGSNAVAIFGQIQFADSGATPDPWGRWGLSAADFPRTIHTVVLKVNIQVQLPLPLIPRGIQVNLVASPALNDTIRGFALFLEGPAELISPEFFRAIFSNFNFSNSF